MRTSATVTRTATRATRPRAASTRQAATAASARVGTRRALEAVNSVNTFSNEKE